MSRDLSLSFVVEWENAGRIGAARAFRMLSELRNQVVEIAPAERPELIFVYEGASREESAISDAVAGTALDRVFAVRLAPSATRDYYRQKNFGATLAHGDLILFIDSDVVPQTGWLRNLLLPFDDPDIGVVGGTSFIEVDGLYSASMALGWLFPLEGEIHGLTETRSFFANNVAFRSDLFRRHPFPATGQYRGHCIALAEELRRHGHRLYMSGDASVLHPPPEGAGGFVMRALRRGLDEAVALRRKGKSPFLYGTAATALAHASAMQRIWKHRRRFGLGPLAMGAAAAIVSANYLLQFAGLAASCAAPRTTRRLLIEGKRPARPSGAG